MKAKRICANCKHQVPVDPAGPFGRMGAIVADYRHCALGPPTLPAHHWKVHIAWAFGPCVHQKNQFEAAADAA